MAGQVRVKRNNVIRRTQAQAETEGKSGRHLIEQASCAIPGIANIIIIPLKLNTEHQVNI